MEPQPWLKRTWVIVALGVVTLGIYPLWRHTSWNRWVKVGLTTAVVIFAIGSSANEPEEAESLPASPTAAVELVEAATAAGEPRTQATAVPSVTPTDAPVAATVAVATPSEPPKVIQVELVDVSALAWDAFILGTRVHFVARVDNVGTVPVELRDIRYRMFSPSGATIETGSVDQSYPRKIAPGASAVIGRTITADTAERPDDVGSVVIEYSIEEVDSADNLLDVNNVELRGENSLGQIEIVGDVANRSEQTYDDINIAVIMVDSAGRWVGYATADLPVSQLRPNEIAQFVTDADLPGFVVSPHIASIEVIAFDR